MNRRNFLRNLTLGSLGLAAADSSLHAFDFGGIDVGKVVEGGTKMASGAGGVGLKQEMAIGGSVATKIVANNNGLLKTPEAARRIALLGKSLARYSYRPTLNFRFAIMDTDIVNGFSAPGGYVFISRGLVEAVKNDDQLAGVLAHEISHITRRHALQIISRGQFVSGMVDVASGSSSDFAQFDVGIDKVTNTLMEKGFDPDIEFEADAYGAKLAYDTGFAKNGLLEFLKLLKVSKGGDHERVFSTHPPLSERIEKLAELS
ncbi:MAG: M48 family metalloprotease [Verrucomicrobiae bacterium]|nr:M48 family metalloprotease [Verrucomicrobiae bacterium]